ncbi:MAG TPA: hypothetical protein DD729_00015 [Rhodobacteraceae bacterium]|nr:hypothetical protein [Paracoccaceae bacterium]
MKHIIMAVFIAAISIPASTTTVYAGGKIQRACMKSDRKAVSRQLCSCIQVVANKVLTKSDQRKAAKFFKDPQKAQDVRMTKTRSTDAFWERYKSFGRTARNYCR